MNDNKDTMIYMDELKNVGSPIVDKIIRINKMNFIKRWWEKRKLSKEFDKIAPSFSYMRHMVTAIDMISVIFFYDNNPKKSPIATEHMNTKPQKMIRGIFLNASSSVQSEAINCIVLNISEYTRIRILMYHPQTEYHNQGIPKRIKVVVENQKGEVRVEYEWEEEKSHQIIKDNYDEMFFINLENELMNRYKKLVMSCIK